MRSFFIIKRCFDIFLALVLGLILLPVIVATGLFVFSVSGKLLFVQTRIGKNEKSFRIFKFRTLDVNMDFILGGEPLRKLGLDELPQLWNILSGEMSFVGPRPLLSEYLSKYSEIQKRRHEVKPGLIGLAQINGFNDLSWINRFKYDVFYVDHCSLSLDTYVFLRTLFLFLTLNRFKTETKSIADSF